MKKFYCIIQGRCKQESVEDEYTGYSYNEEGYWKQIIKDIIVAKNKKEARSIANERYNNSDSIPMRYKRDDIKGDSLLLSLYEIDEDNAYFSKGFFDQKVCSVCGKSFNVLDKYNFYGSFGCEDHCSPTCATKEREELASTYEDFNYSVPVIYKITQISTNKSYIGQTQRSFTLRWWEHIKRGNSEKFHSVLQNTPISDWTFQVLEELPLNEKNEVILERETFWINEYNAIEEGFNHHVSTTAPSKNKAIKELEEMI